MEKRVGTGISTTTSELWLAPRTQIRWSYPLWVSPRITLCGDILGLSNTHLRNPSNQQKESRLSSAHGGKTSCETRAGRSRSFKPTELNVLVAKPQDSSLGWLHSRGNTIQWLNHNRKRLWGTWRQNLMQRRANGSRTHKHIELRCALVAKPQSNSNSQWIQGYMEAKPHAMKGW